MLLLGLAFLAFGCQNHPTNTSPGTVTPPPGNERLAVAEVAARSAEDSPVPLFQWSLDETSDSLERVQDHKGQPGLALRFDGQSQSLTLPVDINPGTMPQVTLAVWARYTGAVPAEGVNQVLSHDDGGFDRSLGIDHRGENVGWSAFAGSQAVLGGVPVRPEEWTFLAVTYDQPARVVQLYVDETKLSLGDAEMGEGFSELTVGANPGFGENFPGDLGHFQVFDRVLTDAEIASLREK